MSDMGISPEDRERLAKTKFGEWFDEFWDKKFEESFDKKVASVRSQRPGTPPQGPPPSQEQPPPPQRRRSLLEECFSSTFGF